MYDNVRVRINGRLDTIQAAVLLSKFEVFEKEMELRQKVANNYSQALKDVVQIPFVRDFNIAAWA